MRLPVDEHLKHPWLVSTLAPDFELLDVWRYPLELDQSVSLRQFMDFMTASQRDLVSSGGASGALFRLRSILGRLFGWDDDETNPPAALSIPGCVETSLRERLADEDRMDEPLEAGPAASVDAVSAFKPVYRRENESLVEISNATVHAMMHVGRVAISNTHWSPQMGVYVKPRGPMGKIYMMLISPFRHYIVYPAMMRMAKKGWPAYAKEHRLVYSDGISK